MLELKKGIQLADRYTLARRLGGESDTHTWLAKDRLTKAYVALKIVNGDAGSAARLRAEWQASIRLMHAHIVRAFEFHSESDCVFYSQQYIDGADISVLAGRSPQQILGPISFVADALAYVHAKGIVHRDIKASNILIDSNGAPYLSDFGVATPAGQIGSGGSPVAQSPQSLAGEAASPTDDIFALGSLIYELIAGIPPWSPQDIAAEIKTKTAAPLRTATGLAVADPIAALVASMLDKDAANRPTANDVVSQLRDAGFASSIAQLDMSEMLSPTQVAQQSSESVESIRPQARTTEIATPVPDRSSVGLNPRTVGVALATLILVLVGVIFVLPDNVSDEVPLVIEAMPEGNDNAEAGPAPVVRNIDGRPRIYVDPEIRRRIRGDTDEPVIALPGEDIRFSENRDDVRALDEQGRARYGAEIALGELLSAFEVLEGRGVAMWAGMQHRKARDYYLEGDSAYLEKDFEYAEELYLGALTVLEPLYDKIEPMFRESYEAATSAFEMGDRLEALRLFELAVAITPTHRGAQAGYERARNLEAVLRLVEQGVEYEEDLDLDAAQRSFERATELDPDWQPAHAGIVRIQDSRTKREFDSRMSEGFEAIANRDFLAARAAFRVAQQLMPGSAEPADGLLQVDQGLRLSDISTLEREVKALEEDEHWDAVVSTYQEILKVDGTIEFAREGLVQGRKMSALHTKLDKLIADPDRLSVPAVMQDATMLVVDITTRADVGPRLAGQRDELSRLLKRAVTPLTVPLLSDNSTYVTVYQVGMLGQFMRKELSLRPGTYVAVGSRAGFRDVRLEFRVAPEIDMQPVVVQCEEQI